MFSLSSEPITVGYAPDTYKISESAGSVTLTISITSHADTGAPRPLTLFVSTEDGTAGILKAPHENDVIIHSPTRC